MAASDDLRKLRAGNGPAPHLAASAKGQMYANAYAANGIHKDQHNNLYIQQPASASHYSSDGTLGSIHNGFGAMSLNGHGYASTRASPQGLTARGADMSGLSMNHVGAPYLMGNMAGMSNMGNPMLWATSHAQNGVSPSASIYAPPMGPAYYGGWQGQFMDHSPHNNSHNNTGSFMSSRAASSEMPALVSPRRDSDSTNEIEPGTPFTTYTGGYNGVNILDHSPGSVLQWTPSPNSNYNGQYYLLVARKVSSEANVMVQGKPTAPHNIPPEFHHLLTTEPAIPRAVPAPNSPIKTLDRALQNPHGITNVYIRGLQPDTTDDTLQNWALRFGDIISSKSIIDHGSGKCKGYGFVKYHNYKDAEKCIRGFHYMGYESSFARVRLSIHTLVVGHLGSLLTAVMTRSLSTLFSRNFRMTRTRTSTSPTCPRT